MSQIEESKVTIREERRRRKEMVWEASNDLKGGERRVEVFLGCCSWSLAAVVLSISYWWTV